MKTFSTIVMTAVVLYAVTIWTALALLGLLALAYVAWARHATPRPGAWVCFEGVEYVIVRRLPFGSCDARDAKGHLYRLSGLCWWLLADVREKTCEPR